MNKIIVIGIDGMDFQLVDQWKDELPVFSKMMKQEMFFPLESVFPPDSVPSWATIYTGLNPMEHGVLHHVNYLSYGEAKLNIDAFKGKTFWDVAGKQGKKVCIVNPFMAYPVWDVNGVMVNGPSFVSGNIQSFPEDAVKKFNKLPNLGGLSDFPTKNTIEDFIQTNREDIVSIKDFTFKLFKADNYDLCFITFLNLDRIQHFLWRYYDENDPTYPGKNQFSNTIKNFYIFFDNIIHEFQMTFPESVIMVLSDHGHGRRCTDVVNINEFLRQKGYLFSKADKARLLSYKFIIEKTKVFVLNLFYKYNIEDFLYKITPYIPYKKSLKESTFLIEPSENLAEIDTQFGGVGSFGGIRINKAKIKNLGIEYTDFRKKIITEVKELSSGIQGRDLFKWICVREDIYSGDYIEMYPDILFELSPEYGASPLLYTKIFSKNITHKKISGGHRRYGILGLSNLSDGIKTKSPSLIQVAPTILDIMDCYQDFDAENKSILEKDSI